MSRTIAIGDVHGCAEEFEELLDALNIFGNDRVIQVGDLVNRGPDSHRVIELCRIYKVESILGNHELRLLTARREKKPGLLKDYDEATIAQLTPEDWAFLQDLPRYRYEERFDTIFVHGGFVPGKPWQLQGVDLITSVQVITAEGKPAKRSDAPEAQPWADTWRGPPSVVYGHTPRPKVLEHPHAMGIDTGCVYGGHLTAYVLDDRSLVQVRARKTYAHSKRLPDPI